MNKKVLACLLLILPNVIIGQQKTLSFNADKCIENNTGSLYANDILISLMQTFECGNLVPTMFDYSNNSKGFRADSAIITRQDEEIKRIYAYDEYGNLITEKWQTYTQGNWLNQVQYAFTYDEYGNKFSYLTQLWEDNSWANLSISNYEYGISGEMLVREIKQWSNEGWVNYGIITFYYNPEGKLLSYQSKRWVNDQWENQWLATYTYDSNGNLLTDLHQYWVNNVWENSELKSYSYDLFNNQLTFLLQDWDDTTWANIYIITRSYDGSGNILTIKTTFWHNNGWHDAWLLTYIYDSNEHITNQLNQYWENGELETYGMHTNIYDVNFNCLSQMYQTWGVNSYSNERKTEYSFLSGKVEATAFDWDWQTNDWVLSTVGSRFDIIMVGDTVYTHSGINMDFYYSDVTGIEEQNAPLENEIIHCYPNPATNQINIEINPAWQTDDFQIELFNQTGQRVKSVEISSGKSSSEISLDVGDVPPGLYLLRVTAGQSASTRKIIISK